jgi:cytochrome c
MYKHSKTSKVSFWIFLLVLASVSCKKGSTTADMTPPEENRFTTTIVTKPGALDEPMEMVFTHDEKILFVERKGALKSFDLKTNQVKTIATIPVNTKYTSKEGRVTEAEEGLMGIVADPNFDKNHWIYMYYADTAEAKHVLARWELRGDSLYANTKKIVLEVPTQRETCCHTGGGMVFDNDGNLFLTTGNNTGNPVAGTSGLDERPDRSSWDDQRTAGNTNDLRGKILRIHPEEDGTYTIPKGNLFPEGTAKTRPEIYTMGHRNPWRVSIDNETGYIYWGEVGPDASKDSIIGPRGYDEFNQAKKPGFFGWPYFIGDNKAYSMFDYATDSVGEVFNVDHPVNNSPNNTGLKELPVPQKAFIWYPYANSPEFPLVGSSGRSATGGPVFRSSDFENAKRPFPGYFEGKWLIVEFMRGWIMSVTMDDNGDFKSMERFLPKENFSSAIDMKFSPDGDLYVLEYGSAWFRGNENAQIKRIEFNGGNRKPVVHIAADKTVGAIPFNVNLSSAGTLDYDDYDKNALKYEWVIKSDNGFEKVITDANPTLTLDKAGTYTVNFTVTDSKGEKNSQMLELKAGNEPPLVDIEISQGNKTFFFQKSKIAYSVNVTDKEDGTLAEGKIKNNEVAINFDYVPEGFDLIEIAQNHRAADEWAVFSAGLNLINKSDCKSCHLTDKKSVGPSYMDIAAKYKGNKNEQERIATKIIEGGGGVCGDHAMSAHPQITKQDANTIVKYIVGLAEKKSSTKELPLSGTFVLTTPPDDNGRGGYLLRAAYKDRGTKDLGSIAAEKIIPLRNPVVDPEEADTSRGLMIMTTPRRSLNMVGSGGHLGYKALDMSGIKEIEVLVQASPRAGASGGTIEVHLDSPEGKLIGTSEAVVPREINFRRLMANNPPPSAQNRRNTGPPAPQPDFATRMRMSSIHAVIPIEGVEGPHDVYFVFKNPQAASNQILMQVIEIEFRQQLSPPKAQ